MSMPCDTGLCNPSKCSDELCPTGLDVMQQRPLEEMATITSPFFSLTDQNKRTNNTLINRYLESRKPRIPGELKLMSKLADLETIRRLKQDLNIK